MIGFWLLAGLLLAAAFGLFIPALRRQPVAPSLSRREINLLIHRDRREELAREEPESGATERLSTELDRELLHDLDNAAPAPRKPPLSGRRTLYAALAAAPVFGLALYLALGRPDLVTGIAVDSQGTALGEIEATIQRLAEKLAREPKDVDGWVLLGRSLQATGKPDRAAGAYEIASKLTPDNLDVKALYAQALAETHRGSLAGRPSELIAEILKADARHPAGLWMAGLAAAERRDVAGAVGYWRKLRAALPEGSDEARELDSYIARVQDLPASPAGAPEAPAMGSAGGIRVKVAIAAALKDRARPEDTVFIFARAAEGPPMPLAIVRKQVQDLPIEVTLDDSMAMTPNRKLSAFPRIILGARVSRSGQAMPTPGDLEGRTEPVANQAGQTFAVEIARIVP